MTDSSGIENFFPEFFDRLESIVIILDVNVNALSAVAAKQIANARAPR